MKRKILSLVLCSFIALGLFGCGGMDSTTPSETDTKATDRAESKNESIKSTNEDSRIKSINNLKDAQNEVKDFGKKLNSVKVPKEDKKAKEIYHELNIELEELENKIDVLDDDLEILYREDKISREEYSKKEKIVDKLERDLDKYEDKLEMLFGIDD